MIRHATAVKAYRETRLKVNGTFGQVTAESPLIQSSNRGTVPLLLTAIRLAATTFQRRRHRSGASLPIWKNPWFT